MTLLLLPPLVFYGLVFFYGALCFLFVISYFIKDIFPFNYIWGFTKLFLIILLATLGINYIKKNAKDWWNKD
jgi:hypothetical protein